MKKIFVVALLPAAVLLGGAYWALNTPWLSLEVARGAIRSALPGARVTELAAVRQRFSWPDSFTWDNVRIGIEIKGRTYHVTAPGLMVSGVRSILRDRSLLAVSVTNADALFPPGEAKGVQAAFKVSLQGRQLVLIEGPVTIASVAWDKIEARQVVFQFSGGLHEFEFRDIRAAAYGGTITGSARVVPVGLAYSADITVAGLETAELADLNDQIASQVAGRVNGHMRLVGRGDILLTLESDWSMSNGAKVNAALLSLLTQYIPQSEERKRLDALILKGGQLPVEVLAFQLRSDTPRHLGGEIKLKSREVNLELNITNDINTDGTLTSLVDYWKAYLK